MSPWTVGEWQYKVASNENTQVQVLQNCTCVPYLSTLLNYFPPLTDDLTILLILQWCNYFKEWTVAIPTLNICMTEKMFSLVQFKTILIYSVLIELFRKLNWTKTTYSSDTLQASVITVLLKLSGSNDPFSLLSL